MTQPAIDTADDAPAPRRDIDIAIVAALFAVDPVGTGGVALHALAGPVRDRWLAQLRALLPASTPLRRVPISISDGRLLGGLDLAATLQAGRPVAERGVLAECDGGVLLLAMAERLSAPQAARITAALDAGEVLVERDGLALRNATKVGIVALDEGIEPDERPVAALLDRLAFRVDLSALRLRDLIDLDLTAADIAAARQRLPEVGIADEFVEALCATALALGAGSLRASMFAVQVARVAAALDGRDEVGDDDAALAGRLVIAPRATQLPPPASADDEPPQPQPDTTNAEPPPEESESQPEPESDPDAASEDRIEPLQDLVLDAAQAAIPAGLLAQLKGLEARTSPAQAMGRSGALQASAARGRPAGVRRGEPRAGIRLNVIETLRAAAPWQRLRRASLSDRLAAARVQIRREDFHVTRYKKRSETTIIFVVDASGSSALNRLAEAKGAVELLLADCYARRDRVAVVAFRGTIAELLLPPTRSLVRAKRSLAGLPGGGGTPLATGIDAALALAETARRHGETPSVVLLTDGRANIARDGAGDRARAEADALAAARRLRAAGIAALLIDTSPRPQPAAARLAQEMGARCLPMPYADAAAMSAVVKTAVLPSGTR